MMGQWKVSAEDATSLAKMTRRLIEASTVRPGQKIATGENTTGRSLLTPGHNREHHSVYPAFWTRDPAWVAESGFIAAEDVWGWITLMCETMHGAKSRRLASGAVLLPYSVADHINVDGSPVYYPGTYAADETQGPPWGMYPPHDDQYWLTFTAYAYAKQTGDRGAFARPVTTPMGQVPLSDACELAHNSFPVDWETQLCTASEHTEEHIVDWGYNDSVTKTGKLLFPSLLRLESALKLAELFEGIGEAVRAGEYEKQASTLLRSIPATFYRERPNGEAWLMSATGIGRKPDVWGSALAVCRHFVDDDLANKLARALLLGYTDGTTVVQGQVRHIPTGDGFWEMSQAPEGTYQNGAYWAYATGWYVYALTLVDEGAAGAMFAQFMEHLRSTWTDDLSACAWECINPELNHYKDPGYLTTVALPYVCLKSKGLLTAETE